MTSGKKIFKLFILLAAISLDLAASELAAEDEKKQDRVLIISCDSSNSTSIQKIEIYGVFSKNNVNVTNVRTVLMINDKMGLVWTENFGGIGTAGKLASVFTDILEVGSSLAVYDTNGLLTLSGSNKEILFKNCQYHL